jgi:hypothetical protein
MTKLVGREKSVFSTGNDPPQFLFLPDVTGVTGSPVKSLSLANPGSTNFARQNPTHRLDVDEQK